MKSPILYKLIRAAALVTLAALFSACNMPVSQPTTTSLPPLPTSTTTITLPTLPPIPPLPEDSWAVAPIVIEAPGAGSTVTSPVLIRGVSDSVFEQTLTVQVLGETGNVLYQGPVMIDSDLGVRGTFQIEADFSVDQDQPGRIVVMDESARDGGIDVLASVEVTLLASGTAYIQPATPIQPIVIDLPLPGDVVSGGVVHIEGSSGPQFENTILIILCGENFEGDWNDLCGASGAVLAQQPVMIDAPDIGRGGVFSVDIPYTVSVEQSVRIAVYVVSMRDGGITQLVSIMTFFQP